MEFCGIFIKFGQEDHLQHLQKEGLIYCNPLQFFLTIEDNNLRGDDSETTIETVYNKDYVLQIKPLDDPNTEYKIVPTTRTQLITNRNDPFGNLFCLHSINLLEKNTGEIFGLDVRNKLFGTHFLLIKNTVEFLSRLHKGLEKNNLKYDYDLVQYLDLSRYNGKKSVFQKDKAYEYQKEFRLFIHRNKNDVIQFKIGDITDISILYPSSVVDTLKMKI